MREILIEQAILQGSGSAGHPLLARSAGFREDWIPEAERLCEGFGPRPPGVACPSAIFAQPFLRRYIAVVQVCDLKAYQTGSDWPLGFRFLILPKKSYAALGGDPFEIAEWFPPSWEPRGELPALSLPADRLPRRTVAQVQEVLKRMPDGPVLLGGSQVMVDGGSLVFERSAPDTELLHGLWKLLPTSTRYRLWPASFAFSNRLCFDALVVPDAGGPEYRRYATEQQAGDYPEGRYELNLQIAAEADDQYEINGLFARRSRAEVWKFGLGLLIFTFIVLALSNQIGPKRERPRPNEPGIRVPNK